ncbi:MAG: hypothetical protein AAF657_22090 [Acidobacteriota bacterium]
MQKKKVRPLKLDRETLRVLTPKDLERAAARGGNGQTVSRHNSCFDKV